MSLPQACPREEVWAQNWVVLPGVKTRRDAIPHEETVKRAHTWTVFAAAIKDLDGRSVCSPRKTLVNSSTMFQMETGKLAHSKVSILVPPPPPPTHTHTHTHQSWPWVSFTHEVTLPSLLCHEVLQLWGHQSRRDIF